jgi:hypothetical protein
MERELPAAYARLTEISSATVTWNDGGDDVRIVAVGDEHCVIALKSDETWYYWLSTSDEDEEVYTTTGGFEGEVPSKALAPRELALTVLLRADDLPGLRTDYIWTEGVAHDGRRSARDDLARWR